jgi:hypothetical protein
MHSRRISLLRFRGRILPRSRERKILLEDQRKGNPAGGPEGRGILVK